MIVGRRGPPAPLRCGLCNFVELKIPTHYTSDATATTRFSPKMKQVFIRGAYLGIGIVSGVVSKSIFDRLSYKEEDILLWSDSRDIVERYGFPSRTETLRYKNYVVGYDSCRKTPAWVLQTLTRKNLGGDAKRDTCAFKKDTRIDKRFSASDEDFIKSGFSKGHMAPAGLFLALN